MREVLLIVSVIGVLLIGIGCDDPLEKGTIKGNVSDDDVPVSGAIVMLLEEGELLAGGSALSNAFITDGSGNYQIILVEPNRNYYVCAIEDNDGDLTYTPGSDRIGYFGRFEVIWIPTPVSVSSGETKSGINIRDMI